MERGVLMGPGVATPSEAVAAWNMGVKLLKLFPIGALGTDYFAAMFGPLKHMSFMCNGAMNDQNAREFLQAGAVACGMGGWLVGDGELVEVATAQSGADFSECCAECAGSLGNLSELMRLIV